MIREIQSVLYASIVIFTSSQEQTLVEEVSTVAPFQAIFHLHQLIMILYSIINLSGLQRIKIKIDGYAIVTSGKVFITIDMDRSV